MLRNSNKLKFSIKVAKDAVDILNTLHVDNWSIWQLSIHHLRINVYMYMKTWKKLNKKVHVNNMKIKPTTVDF